MTQRLIGTALHRWVSFDGWALTVMTGGDPLDLPLDRLLNLIYHWLTNGAEQEEIDKFDRRLWMPPKGEAAPINSPWSAEAETSSFKAFIAQVGTAPAPVSKTPTTVDGT